jgi:TolA-binding protein
MEIAATYIADEKFADAIPYLNKVLSSSENGLKPRAYLKSGLAHYNSNNNKAALTSYEQLINKYPQSAEAEEAMSIIRDIYVEEGRPDDYVSLMQKNGISVSVSEADSLSYTSAFLKYNVNDCAAAIPAFSNYLTRYPEGSFGLDAYFFRSECYKKNKDWRNALTGYEYVNNKGLSKYFEEATLDAARINYFELKDYGDAKKYFESLSRNAASENNRLEALRGFVRSTYQLKEYSEANTAARELLASKGINTDDRSVAFLVLGKSQQKAEDCASALTSFKSAAAINKSAWGAEARYEIAACHFEMKNFPAAEKAGLAVIKETGSYDYWVTKSYILLGDIFMIQKDYFNAKATYESVSKKASFPELKNEAQQKLERAVAEEKQNSKIDN